MEVLRLSIRDEILDELRSGRPFAEVRTSARSKSQLYEAIRQYLDETEVSLEDQQEKLIGAKEERSEVEAEVEARRSEVESLREEKQNLEEDKISLGSELSKKTAKLATLEEKAEEFRTQGFTLEVMKKLEPLIARGGDSLLRQVETVGKCTELEKDLTGLKKSKVCLLKEVRTLERKKEQAQASVVSTRNRVDELRLEARPIKDAVNTVVRLMKIGFTIEDIRSLGYGLDFLGVEEDSDLSISRLIIGLKKQKNLTILHDQVTRKRQEFVELDSAVKDAKTTLAIIKDKTLKSINEAKGASIQAIQSTAKASNEEFAVTCEKFDGCLQSSLQNFGVRAEEKLRWMEEQYRQRKETDQQKMLFERALAYGRFMQGFFESDEFLLRVSLSSMLQVARRLHLWVREKMPKGTMLPSDSVVQRQFGLTRFQSYNLAILAELMCEGLEAASSKESINVNGAKTGVNSCQD
jgi:hypothetical protein